MYLPISVLFLPEKTRLYLTDVLYNKSLLCEIKFIRWRTTNRVPNRLKDITQSIIYKIQNVRYTKDIVDELRLDHHTFDSNFCVFPHIDTR